MKQEEKDRIVYLYKKLGTYKAVQQEIGHSSSTIWKVIKEAGINVGTGGNQKTQQKLTDELLLADIALGLTRQEIADKRNVHVTRVDRRMKKLGVHAEYAKIIPANRRGYGECWHFVGWHYKLVEQKHPNYEYLETQKKNGYKRVRLKCKRCGTVIERAESTVMEKRIKCNYCEQEDKSLTELLNERIILMRVFDAIKEKKTPKTCPVCGQVYFTENKLAKYCSQKCKRKNKNHGGYRHRCKKYGAIYDANVTRVKVIKRDGGVCQICGKACNENDKRWGIIGPDFPTIDHIKPLAKGGTHTWDNVQCACAMCNSIKRDLYTA